MTAASMLKRTYDAVALLSVLNLAGMAALLVCLVALGALDGQKAKRIVALMRGEETFVPKAQHVELSVPAEETEALSAELPSIEESQAVAEITRREAERVKEELRQRLAVMNGVMIRVTAEREAFENLRETSRREEQEARSYRETQGFAKQVAIFDALNPKTAAEHLLNLSDQEEAARILMAVKTRQAKKIIESAKRGDQGKQMMAILRRLKEVSPLRSVELGE